MFKARRRDSMGEVPGLRSLATAIATPCRRMASIGGTVLFGATAGATVHDGDTYTIFTAEGGLTGTFNAPQSLSAILKPTLSYTANAVDVTIEAGSYLDVVNPNSPVQVAYANLLDANRGTAGQFDAVWSQIAGTGWENLKDCTNGTLEKRDPVYQFDVGDDENKSSFSCQTREVPYPYFDITNALDQAAMQGAKQLGDDEPADLKALDEKDKQR